ncbi:hypothetical protein ACOME3_003038 [Neoechinorhynchus agilis]
MSELQRSTMLDQLSQIIIPTNQDFDAALARDFKNIDDQQHQNQEMPSEVDLKRQLIIMGTHSLEVRTCPNDPHNIRSHYKLYVCPHCLSILTTCDSWKIHESSCQIKYPPKGVAVFESKFKSIPIILYRVRGSQSQTYCKNLAFLGSRFNVSQFDPCDLYVYDYYVLVAPHWVDCPHSENRFTNLVGYFSRMNRRQTNEAFGDLLVWPTFRRFGFGKMLLDVSFELCRREGRAGEPARPYTAIGYEMLLSYCTEKIFIYLLEKTDGQHVDINQMSSNTGINADLIRHCLDKRKLLVDCNSQWFGITKVKGMHELIAHKRIERENGTCVQYLINPSMLVMCA